MMRHWKGYVWKRYTFVAMLFTHLTQARPCMLAAWEGEQEVFVFFMIRQKMGTSHWALICFCWVGLWRFAEVMHMCSLLTLYCSGSWTVWFKCCRAFRSAAVRFTPWTVGLLFYRFTFFCFPRNPQFLFFVPDQRFGNSLNDVNPSECETPQYSWWRRVRKNTCHLNSLVLLISRFWGKSCSMCSRIWAVWFLPASHLISNHYVRFLIIF